MGRFLVGKTPARIAVVLGLPIYQLAAGAKIYKFKRLPMAHEVEYELTADYPDGLAYNPPHSSTDYPPGAPYVQQWRIVNKMGIPVDEPGALSLKAGEVFPYSWIAR